jgi:hypothetical protein
VQGDEESPLLGAVARERLEKGLAGAVDICKVKSLAITLYLLLIPSDVHRRSVNPISPSVVTHPYIVIVFLCCNL